MQEDKIRQLMQKAVEMVQGDVGTIRTGRATSSLVENIEIEAYGGTQKLRVLELATITPQDAQTLVISPWDKSIIGDIKKGIEESGHNLKPVITGEDIRINLPPLTQEQRENYIKLLKTKLETGKVSIRHARQDGMHQIRKDFEEKVISEDEKDMQEKKLQEITDEYIKQIDGIGSKKEEELRSV